MKTAHKSDLIWYTALEIYALVIDLARYPQFLPRYDHSLMLGVHADSMTATVEFNLRYGFDNAALGGPVFDRIVAGLVEAFVIRAGHLYGE
jgi:ribosome-associated toxin RatA of RatAB toxin-antitoxin module